MIDNHADDRQKLHGARGRQRGSTENVLDTARLGKARLRACLAAAFSLTRHARQEAQTNENSDDVPPIAGNLPVGSPGPQ